MDGLAFKHEAMTSSATGKRIKHCLECATLYARERKHGFRRGHIQADAASELSTDTKGWLQAQDNTSSVVELYRHPIRHSPEVERLTTPCLTGWTVVFYDLEEFTS